MTVFSFLLLNNQLQLKLLDGTTQANKRRKKEGSSRIARQPWGMSTLYYPLLKILKLPTGKLAWPPSPALWRSAAEARELQEQGAVQPHELCPLRSQRAMPHWRRIHCCSQKALQTLLSWLWACDDPFCSLIKLKDAAWLPGELSLMPAGAASTKEHIHGLWLGGQHKILSWMVS